MPQKDRAVIKQQYSHDPQYVRCRHELSEGQSQCYAIFMQFGIRASSKERFTILVMTGSNLGKHLATTEAGSGSRAQVFTLEDLIKLAIKSVETR